MPLYAEAAVLLEHREAALRLAGEQAPPLGRACYAIQRWARSRFAAHRSRRYDWRAVEAEFRAALVDGSLSGLDGMTRAAIPLLEQVVAAF